MSYMVVRVYSFECDALSCDEAYHGVVPLPLSHRSQIGAARKEMAELGWSCEPDADYCPKHRVRTP